MNWDIFCRVIDNHGDLGVCWRLARQLAQQQHVVRLWIDDASALSWMAPEGAPGVSVQPWRDPLPHEHPGDVVVEAFGCDPPPAFLRRMREAAAPPVWVNLEYLSAEAYVTRSHGLASPQFSGPAMGLTKWFFYPGFTAGTGGLLREGSLASEQAQFDRAAWRAAHGVPPEHRLLSLFCYTNPSLPAFLQALSHRPTTLLLTPGYAAQQAQSALGPKLVMGALQGQPISYRPQAAFDHLLWACDLNFVRGEDSVVRALWAQQPMIWQIYPQDDGAHHAKLDAFLNHYLADAEPDLAHTIRQLMWAWNQHPAAPSHLPDLDAVNWPAWQAHARHWAKTQQQAPDLCASLTAFVHQKRLK